MHSHGHDHDVKPMTTRQLLRMWLEKKVGVTNKRPAQRTDAPRPEPGHGHINTIAIVLDGEVQEVIRAENRLTALLLSSPEFILTQPTDVRPTIGWKYINGEFKDPNEENQVSNG